ncbi:general secretion pathway protein GspB [Pseudidiomarina sediminum]|uniref:general secretion pathway protein GspB n=1 Tax=Pseudidiomarina sediminum TaxID=431675 RepID=UPI001C98A607|nr:general secretion pathway protein GspB [Pseudidiomarina sediminum]MBY6064661.1 general secretion pathway protein GspB [Pseudidiomarina sediminum]
MSSVLKALRQQQADFAPQHQAIHLDPVQQTKSRSNAWWLVVTVPLAVAIGGVAVWLAVPTSSAPTQTTPVQQAPTAAEFQLGTPEPVRVVSLPEVQQRTPTPVQEQPAAPPVTSNFAEAPALERNQAVDLNQVSPDLLAAFEEAVALTSGAGETRTPSSSSSVLPRLGALPVSLQQRVPSFSYDAHQYSSRERDRFITFNNQRLRQGDSWQNVQVLTIAPNHVVLAVGNQAFQQPALEDWTN